MQFVELQKRFVHCAAKADTSQEISQDHGVQIDSSSLSC